MWAPVRDAHRRVRAELHARRLQPRELGPKIVDLQGQMGRAGPVGGDVQRFATRIGVLNQLEQMAGWRGALRHAIDVEERHLEQGVGEANLAAGVLLVMHHAVHQTQAEQVAVEGYRAFEVGDGEAEVKVADKGHGFS